MTGVAIKTLERLEDVRDLEDMLTEYIRFVTSDLERATGIVVDTDRILGLTLAKLDQVVPPNGLTFVAEDADGARLGMAFLRPSGPDAMEIKRLYVPPTGRGRGIGKALVAAIERAARDRGAGALRIDTTRNLEAAIALYRGLGFEERTPYPESDHYDDADLGPAILFMEKRL